MIEWSKSEQICRHFRVGPERLLSYATRGNLGFRRLEDGTQEYDLTQVNCLFAPRQACLTMPEAGDATSLGRLGTLQLGTPEVLEALEAVHPGTSRMGPDTPAEMLNGHRRRTRATRGGRAGATFIHTSGTAADPRDESLLVG